MTCFLGYQTLNKATIILCGIGIRIDKQIYEIEPISRSIHIWTDYISQSTIQQPFQIMVVGQLDIQFIQCKLLYLT